MSSYLKETESHSGVTNSLWSHEIFQARILEWVAIPFSRESSQQRDLTQASRIAAGFFTNWATREAQIVGQTLFSAVSKVKMFLDEINI